MKYIFSLVMVFTVGKAFCQDDRWIEIYSKSWSSEYEVDTGYKTFTISLSTFYYYDRKTISYKKDEGKDIVSVWLKHEPRGESKIETRKDYKEIYPGGNKWDSYDHSIIQMFICCKEKSFKTVKVVFYNINGKEIFTIDDNDFQDSYSDAVSESNPEYFIDAICNRSEEKENEWIERQKRKEEKWKYRNNEK